METLGQRIKRRREELELDQVELAKRAGISQPTLANLEAGKNKRTKFLSEIARALNTSAEWLEGAEEPQKTEVSTKLEADEIIELITLYKEATAKGRNFILQSARVAERQSALLTTTAKNKT